MTTELKKLDCPCCKLPTLNALGASEICFICEWQDDGQIEENQDEVMGGANGKYSLALAQKNFNKNKFMYRKGDENFPDNPSFLRLQEELVELYEEFSDSLHTLNVSKFINEIQTKKEITPKFK